MDELTLAIEQARVRLQLPPPAERRRLRRRSGLTQDAIARALGVTPVSVCRWERGARTPSRRFAPLYADLLSRLAREAERINGGKAAEGGA